MPHVPDPHHEPLNLDTVLVSQQCSFGGAILELTGGPPEPYFVFRPEGPRIGLGKSVAVDWIAVRASQIPEFVETFVSFARQLYPAETQGLQVSTRDTPESP